MIPENQVEWVHRPDMSSGPRTKKPAMSTHPEHHSMNHLFELIDGLDEGTQWALIRELKLTAHTVAKDLENQA